jgi:uncharacterized membrane protein
MEQSLGPVEYLVVAFEGNQFKGEIVPALIDLLDQGLIRVIDLAIVSKDANGDVVALEANELMGDVAEALAKLEGEFTGLLSEEDLKLAAEELEPNSTAAAMLFEHVWATRFAESIRNANGRIVLNARIPNDVVEATRQSLIEASRLV